MIKFVSMGKFPIKETFVDMLHWNKWLVNGWIERHLPCALIGSLILFWISFEWSIFDSILFCSVLGWFVSRGFEYYQDFKKLRYNPFYKFSQKEKTESAKDWIFTTLCFVVFSVLLNLIFK